MFEGLIEFIEQSVFSMIQQIVGRDVADVAHGPIEGARTPTA